MSSIPWEVHTAVTGTSIGVRLYTAGLTIKTGESDPVNKEAGYVDVDDGRLFYESIGSGHEAIIFIHGRAGDRRHWDAQFEALGSDYRVVRYDVRCFGKSSLPSQEHVYADHRDLLQLLDGLSIESAHIAGWSMGCGIAVDFVVANPLRARSLIAIGPWVNGYTSTSPAFEEFVPAFGAFGAVIREKGPEFGAEAWMRLPFFAQTICDADAGSAFERIAADQSWADWTPDSQQESLKPSAFERLGDIAAPTLILTAQNDVAACAEVADLLDASVRNSTKVVIPETGHLMHMEKPQEFNRHLLNFLRDV
jgi:pimeloyl-ACP methyl ester carboxylesterase